MTISSKNWDVIVVGGGHAGAEAAYTSARLGAKTLLITINIDHIGQMSCNPAIGGIAKGHVVREIDALGGIMARVAEAATIQFRMLNRGKGPAVWSPRAQCDRFIYQHALKCELEKTENLEICQGMIESFIVQNSKLVGVTTHFGEELYAKAIVICSGTFLNGKLHYGFKTFQGGRAGDPASVNLSKALRKQLGLKMGRLKTGTPNRILGKSIDFNQMQKQDAEILDENFTFFDDQVLPKTQRKDLNCYLVKTTKKTAKIVKDNLDKAPMYQGRIKGTGTRYCPSFEDKIVRFPDHETHTLYLEPEGEFTDEYYINGFSTSLPVEVQWEMLHSIPGLEKAVITRYAYAIEYDFVLQCQLERTLTVKGWDNLFLAGQINGTSGYEEAAGQGLIAGLNAARFVAEKPMIEMGRELSYIGVMIDDLATKDIVEPYRLFTSRAEYRLHLRQDSADLRLCPFAYELGLLPEKKYKCFKQYAEKIDKIIAMWETQKYEGKTIRDLLKLYHGNIGDSYLFPPGILGLNMKEAQDRRVLRQLAIIAHYQAYLDRENKEIQRIKTMEQLRIPSDFDYAAVKGLGTEAKIKLSNIRPTTLAQAGRIDGVTPAELTLLRVNLKRKKY